MLLLIVVDVVVVVAVFVAVVVAVAVVVYNILIISTLSELGKKYIYVTTLIQNNHDSSTKTMQHIHIHHIHQSTQIRCHIHPNIASESLL